MEFRFDIKKAMASVAFLMDRCGGELDMFLALKSLYLADKNALSAWGRPITGDEFKALPKGPVLKNIYSLFKGTGPKDLQAEWDRAFSERVNHSIHLKLTVSTAFLSERERKVLALAQDEIYSVAPRDVADFLHQTCPEWIDPDGKSLPIRPESILENAGYTKEQISEMEESERVFQQTLQALGAH